MTDNEFATYIRKITATDSVSFPDADIITYANVCKDYLATQIISANEDIFIFALNRNLEEGKRKYTFEGEILNQMKRLEIKLSEDSGYVVAKEVDMNFLNIPYTEEGIREYMSGRSVPLYDILGGELTILTNGEIQNVSDGLQLYASVYPESLKSLTTGRDLSYGSSSIEVGMPRAFHKVWADMVIRMYNLPKGNNTNASLLNIVDQEIEFEITKALNSITGGNLDREIISVMRYNDGSQY